MNLQFYKKKNNIYTLFNLHFSYLILAVLFLFFFVRTLTYEFNANNIKDKDSLLLMMLFFGVFFLAFSFSIVEINGDKKSITTKRLFTLWKQTAKYDNHDFKFLTIRQSLYGIFTGIDVALEVQYKRFVLKRFFKTQKIDLFMEETRIILERRA